MGTLVWKAVWAGVSGKRCCRTGTHLGRERGYLPSAWAARRQELMLSLALAALQPCKDAEMKLCFDAVNDLDSLQPLYSDIIYISL